MAVVAVLAVAVLLLRDGGDGGTGGGGTTSADWLPVENTGETVQQIEPQSGGTLRVGAASVRIFPGTFPGTVSVSASLGTNGALDVRVEPPTDLALPARITLPLPPGASWGDDPGRWPIIVASGGGGPHLLQPNTVGPSSLSVDVPHFSSFVPVLWKDASAVLAKLGGSANPPPAAQKAPGGVDVGMTLPKDYDTDATVGKVSVSVQANTGGPKPETPPTGDVLPPEWKQFEGVNVKISGFRRPASNQPLEEVVLANEPLGPGGRKTVDVTLPGGGLWEETNAGQAVLVITLIKDGKTILQKTVPTPIGGYWTSFACAQGKDAAASGTWRRFTVYYLKDPNQTGYPDRNYTAAPSPAYTWRDGGKMPAIPKRILDACSALSTAYDAFNGAAYFGDPGNAPSDEMDVWVQNWDENNAGAVTNHIVLSLKAFERDDFRVNAAHELAHRFQHQYSIGLFRSGGWLHDASAEYLAQRVFLPAGETNQTMRRFFGGNPSWVNAGLFSSEETDSYAASSFLAFLADVYGINIAREVWVEGGSGTANLDAWETHLDALVKRHDAASSLAEAWAKYSNAYLVNAGSWGDWTGIFTSLAYTEVQFDAAKSSTLFRSTRSGTPDFSAGGAMFRIANSPAVTVGMHITAFPAQRAFAPESSWYGLSPGDTSNGSVTPLTLTFVDGKADYQGSFRLGATRDAIGPGPKARVTHVYRGTGGGGYNWIRYDAWAIPQLTGIVFDEKTFDLTWEASALEDVRDAAGGDLFETYEVVAEVKGKPGEWRVIGTPGKGSTTFATKGIDLKFAQDPAQVCVRVKDSRGFTGPEACPQLDVFGSYRMTSFRLTSGEPDIVQVANDGRLFKGSALCRTSPSDCWLELYRFPEAGQPDRMVAQLCARDSGTFCSGVADSKKYEPSAGLLAPTVNDNHFTLAGPRLTGSDDVGSHGTPGQPAVINHWRTIDAQFTETKVAGTIKVAQIIFDVVNGQRANDRVISVTFAFEATKEP